MNKRNIPRIAVLLLSFFDKNQQQVENSNPVFHMKGRDNVQHYQRGLLLHYFWHFTRLVAMFMDYITEARFQSLLIDFHTRNTNIIEKQWLPEKKKTKLHVFENAPQKLEVNSFSEILLSQSCLNL